MKKVLVINGPNLNLLGTREKNIYGEKSLKSIENDCKKESKSLDIDVYFFQSNSESKIIEKIQSCKDYKALIINAGAFTHTSVAIHDSLKTLKIPIIEVHISNIYKREEFRKNSFISSVANGIIIGFGADVYLIALKSLNYLLK